MNTMTCLDPSEDLLLVNLVVSGVDDTQGLGVSLLRCSDRRPQHTLAATSGITD